MYKILFVCTGNICRSPTAEGVLRHRLAVSGLEGKVHVDSAGTHAYHVGEAPDTRSVKAASARGVMIGDLRARKVNQGDFSEFNLVLGLDHGHVQSLRRMAPEGAAAEVALFLDYAGATREKEVPDPYYGGHQDFEYVLDLIEAASEALVGKLQKTIGA